MKPLEQNTSPPEGTTLSQVLAWHHSLQLLHARLKGHFARPEPHARALRYVQAVLSPIARTNGWQVAEHAGEATPYGMQRLLSAAVWDAEGVRDAIRTFLLSRLDSGPRIIALDDTGFLKRGRHSAGVSKQHYGLTGDVRNCQVGVFLSLVTIAGHALLDRELYLPVEWTDDPARCARVGIPPTVTFQTKPQLAIRMLDRLLQAHMTIDWVVADSGYGGNPHLRDWLEARRLPYVMAVARDEPVVLELPGIGVRRLEVQDVPAHLWAADWQPLAMSEGTKGPRLSDWACVPLWHGGSDDGWHSLLLRRPLEPGADLTYHLVFAPPQTPLQAKVSAQGGRWRIEEDFKTGKALGLAHYEVRSWVGWYRHITLVMLALAYLVSLVLTVRDPSALGSRPAPSPSGGPPELCPLSVPEARHLLARLLLPPPSSVPFVLAWSQWRRRHQYQARLCHSRHRLKAG